MDESCLSIYTDTVRFILTLAHVKFCVIRREMAVKHSLRNLWFDEQGQDIAEYSVMLAVILVIVVGTVRLIGSNASNVFSQVGSAIQ